MKNPLIHIAAVWFLIAPSFLIAKSTDETVQTEPDADSADLLTQAELENLVAPVALYPDTLLIQILVAATYPMEIIKSDRLLAMNADADPETLTAAIEAEEWDPSVEVLATAFPDVTSDMATHIEWTEAVGAAMLAQSDDVMNAVQTMRQQAINSGALASGEAQTVDVVVDEETQAESVVIQPADPEVVYVPQYDPNLAYNSNDLVSDAIVAGAVTFGTFILLDAIFDDDDPWNDYWGCRNCGGWGGGPIYNNPRDIDIDVDGNVNIGNNVNLGDRPDRRPDGGWKADDKRKNDAKNKITNRKDTNGKTKLPINKADTRGDSLRASLSNKSGAADISRPGNNRLPQVDRPSNRPASAKKAAANRTAQKPKPGTAKRKPSVKKPTQHKAAAKRPAAKKKAPANRKSATHKRAPAKKAHAGSQRGRSSGAKHRKGRR
ncbi:MAG: DUF3300 domain-containing protein [Paracoccaceae bacterium]